MHIVLERKKLSKWYTLCMGSHSLHWVKLFTLGQGKIKFNHSINLVEWGHSLCMLCWKG